MSESTPTRRPAIRSRGRAMGGLVALLVLTACGGDRTHAGLPEEAHARGVITAVAADRVEVAAEAGGPTSATVRLTPETLVRTPEGEVLGHAELSVGQRVSIWYEGPVLESYPTQGTARELVVERGAAAEGRTP